MTPVVLQVHIAMKTPERSRTSRVPPMDIPFGQKSLCYDGLRRTHKCISGSVVRVRTDRHTDTHTHTHTQTAPILWPRPLTREVMIVDVQSLLSSFLRSVVQSWWRQFCAELMVLWVGYDVQVKRDIMSFQIKVKASKSVNVKQFQRYNHSKVPQWAWFTFAYPELNTEKPNASTDVNLNIRDMSSPYIAVHYRNKIPFGYKGP